MALRIKDWDSTFENWKTRSLDSPLRWVNLPTNQDSPVYRMLMSTAAGIHAFGVFISLVEVAGKMPERGVLADDKGDLSIKGLSVRTGIRDGDLRKALAVLTSPEVGWVVSEQPAAHPENNLGASSQQPKNIQLQSSPVLSSSPIPSLSSGDARGAAESPPPSPSPGVSTFVNARQHSAGRYPGFDRVCGLYPPGMLNGINAARNAWTAQDCEPVSAAIEAAIGAYVKCRKWREGYVPALSKFLTERLWEESPPPDPPSPAELKREKGKSKWEAEKARLLAKQEAQQ